VTPVAFFFRRKSPWRQPPATRLFSGTSSKSVAFSWALLSDLSVCGFAQACSAVHSRPLPTSAFLVDTPFFHFKPSLMFSFPSQVPVMSSLWEGPGQHPFPSEVVLESSCPRIHSSSLFRWAAPGEGVWHCPTRFCFILFLSVPPTSSLESYTFPLGTCFFLRTFFPGVGSLRTVWMSPPCLAPFFFGGVNPRQVFTFLPGPLFSSGGVGAFMSFFRAFFSLFLPFLPPFSFSAFPISLPVQRTPPICPTDFGPFLWFFGYHVSFPPGEVGLFPF